MICPNCKSSIPDDSKFCPDCGETIMNIDLLKKQAHQIVTSYKDGYEHFLNLGVIPPYSEYLSSEGLNIIISKADEIRDKHIKEQLRKADDVLKNCNGDSQVDKSVILDELSKMNAEEAMDFEVGLEREEIPDTVYVTDPHLFYILNGFYYVSEEGVRGKFCGKILSPNGHTAIMYVNEDGHHTRVDVFHPSGQIACKYHLHDDGLSFMQIKGIECYNTYGFKISENTFFDKFFPRYRSELDSFESLRFFGYQVTIE